MNLRILIEACTLEELNELSSLIYERREKLYRKEVEKYQLNEDEIQLLKNGRRVAAIKSLRERYGIGLYEAKVVTDSYLGR